MTTVIQTGRDVKIIEQAHLYGMTWPQLVHQSFFSDVTMKATEAVLMRLVAKGMKETGFKPLVARPLFGRRVYYSLTPYGAKCVDAPRSATLPLSPQGIVENYGIASFCLCGEKKRRKLLPWEIEDISGKGELRGISKYRFFRELRDDEVDRLGFIIVDQGAQSRRIAYKASQLILRFSKIPFLEETIREGLFTMGISTGTAMKAARVQASIRSHFETLTNSSKARSMTSDLKRLLDFMPAIDIEVEHFELLASLNLEAHAISSLKKREDR